MISCIKTLFLSLMLIASVEATQISQCLFEASNYALPVGSGTISKECSSLILEAATENQKHKVDDDTIVYGYKNILYFQNKEKLSIFAGTMTQLEDILAVSFDKNDNTIYILDKSNGILAFHSFLAGNVAPIRKVQNSITDSAIDLEYHDQRVHLLHSNKKEISLFHPMANDRNNKNSNSERLKVITLDQKMNSIKIKK